MCYTCRFQPVLIGFLALVPSLVLGQDPRGSILGSAVDPSNAAIPGVEVRVANRETGIVLSAVTNEAGRFRIPFLLSGTYDLSAEHSGFKKFLRESVEVRTAEAVEVTFQMEIGAASERVEVKDEAPPLDTAGASLGRIVDEKRIMGLPQRGGTPVEFELLAPGVVNTTNLRIRGAAGPDALSSMSTNGNPDMKNEYQLDGIFDGAADGGRGNSRPGFSPPTGAVREFKVQTAPYDASVGHTIGAVVSVTTASGTNQLHGELHFWARNSAFDAPNFFNNANGTKPGKYKDDYYGFTVGGPVYIPRVYNGRNKTFWLYSWERRWPHTDPNAFLETVPTVAERKGDFSALLGIPNGNTYQLYDPLTTAAIAGGRFSRQPFAGNVIPQSRLDAVGLKMVNLFGLPTQAGRVDGTNNFFNGSTVNEADYHVHLVRIDHAFSDSHRVFVRLHSDWFQYSKGMDFYPAKVDGLYQQRLNKGLALDDVLVLSPSLVMNVRYGLTNSRFPEWRVSRGFDLASLGFSPSLVNLVDRRLATIPNITIPGYTPISKFERGDGTNTSLTDNVTVNFTKLQGKHNLRFGADLRVDRAFGNRYPTDVSPLISPTNAYTRGPLDNSPGAPLGQELAALLLGIPDGSMTRTASYAVQDVFTGLYFQDDFKLTPRLTLNMGLRYEWESLVTERYNRLVSSFDFNTPNPTQSSAQANYVKDPIPELAVNSFRVFGGLTWVNQGNIGRSPFRSQKNWLPRFGLAYLLTPKTTLRAGYGIYYDTIGVYAFLPIQTGFSQGTPIQASLDDGLTYIANNANPFPNGLLPPLGPKGGLTTNLGQAISFHNPNLKRGYAQRWSLGFQRLFPGEFLVEASYVGNRATRLGVTRQLNVTPAQYLSTKPMRDQATIDFLSRTFSNPFFGVNPIYGRTTSRAGLLLPYPQFGNISNIEPVGYSWYHSLQVQAEKRFSRGYTFQLGYTFSKLMDAVAFLNPTDPLPYRSISALDRPQRLTMTAVWEIPVGRGRRFGTRLWRPANAVVGGWQLTGIVARQAGAPLGGNNGFGDIIFNGDLSNIALPKSQRSADHWFNVNADFNRNSSQQLSYHVRTFPLRLSGVRTNGQASWDFSIQKDFSIHERVKLQFRGEVFNAWNHTNLSAPNISPTSSAFGVITGLDGDPRNWRFGLLLLF